VYETNTHTLEEIRNIILRKISISGQELQTVNVFPSCNECSRSEKQNFRHLL